MGSTTPGRVAEGWPSLLLFLGMLVVLGRSIGEGHPIVVGGADRTSSLTILMVAAALIGFVLARSSLGIVRSHLLGAVAGAWILVMPVGAAVQDSPHVLLLDGDAIVLRLQTLRELLQTSLAPWLVAREQTAPTEATLLILGAICWTTAQFGMFSIVRYERGGPAILGSGTLLFVSVATDVGGEGTDLVALVATLASYSLLAMLLLVRLQLAHQRDRWTRRHIADTGEVGRLFLRSGSVFVLLAVVAASSLTALATVRAPSVDLGALDQPIEDLGDQLSRLLAFALPNRPRDVMHFDDTFAVQDSWEFGPGIAFVATVPGGGLYDNYFFGAAYDAFDGWDWRQSDISADRLDPGEPVELTDVDGQRPVVIEATIEAREDPIARGTVLGASQGTRVGREVVVRRIGEAQAMADIRFDDPLPAGGAYRLTSTGQDYRRESTTLSANQLRAAGTEYPTEMVDRYATPEPGTSGPRVRDLVAQVEAAVRDDANPYDLALEVQRRLRDMEYSTSFAGCDDRPIAECLLQRQSGFCQQYASTMAVVLRALGIPVRLVVGYLPGTRDGDIFSVPEKARHAWVEVWFPGFGWIRFDPTPLDDPSLRQRETDFADGEVVQSPAPDPTRDPREPDLETPEPTVEPSLATVVGDTDEGGGGSHVGLIVGSAGLAVAAGLLAALALFLVWLRRLPAADGDVAYRGIVRLASRLGHGPLPSQTEYEYAASLSADLPTVRDDLYLVAEARVDTRYGQRRVGDDRLAALRGAYARIRTALVRLLWRRGR